jgi:uncharacterized protein
VNWQEVTDLTRLEQFLLSDAAPPQSMGLSDLDGFLAGIAIGPELILPGEWLPAIWGGEEPRFGDREQAQAIHTAILGRYNQILHTLATDPGHFVPLFWEDPEGIVIAADWAEGFLDAVRLRLEAWNPLFQDPEESILLFPILALCGDPEGKNLIAMDDAQKKATFEQCPELIPLSVAGIYRFWRAPARQGKRRCA